MIRNFCIIAHIDHGKSTLSDRMLEITGTVEKRKMKEQLLDSMDLEREKGITIKLTPVRMHYKDVELNLIDTPGHVDFTYEVSRSLAAVEGAVLLVDATQGVQAQTIANLYLAMEQNLTIVPVLNKIDLPAADVPRRRAELVKLLGCREEDILLVSGKTGEGVAKLLDEVIARIPPPASQTAGGLRALIFDSKYDDYKGVVAYVRVVDGAVRPHERLRMSASGVTFEVMEAGALTPAYAPNASLAAGEIGYVATGLKSIEGCRVGDTIVREHGSAPALPGYKVVKPMVYAGVFPHEGHTYEELREAMLKLSLSDAALAYEPEYSPALGHGYRCGFLGMLHMEIVQERLRRECQLEVIMTVPSVSYRVFSMKGEVIDVHGPLEMPDQSHIMKTEEPWVRVDVVTPAEFIGGVMALCTDKRGVYKTTEYLDATRALIHYEMPLASIVIDFYDTLKSITSGYASLNYDWLEYREAEIARVDILVAEEPVEALAFLVFEKDAYRIGKSVVEKLKEAIPKHMFLIKLQAAIGGKIIASERIAPMRKDVTGYLYGGDVTRKRKLLEKQKKGKKKMMAMGRGSVDIPSSAYLAVLKR